MSQFPIHHTCTSLNSGKDSAVISVQSPTRPLIGVSCCTREIAGVPFQTVLQKYLIALSDYAGCDPILIPTLGDIRAAGRLDLRHIVSRLDGILLTGGRSMITPNFYGALPIKPDTLYDSDRDTTTLPIVRIAVEMALPLFGICRGFQEICCAFGGTLEQDLFSKDSSVDHRSPQNVGYSEKYFPTHWVQCTAGGYLSQMVRRVGVPDRFKVNSLHIQGIQTIGPDLTIEAWSDDGLIEAVRVTSARSFAFGVQWHPEWHIEANPVNRMLFEHFGEACKERLARHAPRNFLENTVARDV